MRERSSKRQLTGSLEIQAAHAYDLKRRKFLDYFGDGVNSLGIGEQAVGDGCNDVKGTLHELPRVHAVGLPGPEHALNAVPGKNEEVC